MFVSVSLEDCEYVCDMFVVRTELEKGVASGTKTGQICIWDLYRKRNSGEFVLCPRLLIFGSHGAIVSMAFVRNWSGDRDRIVSLCDKGYISLWDGKDGTCLKTNASLSDLKHSGVKCLAQQTYKETLIAVWGQYSSIYILDSNSLDRICVLKSSHNPNWIAQICFIPNIDKQDALVAITVSGTLKLWLLHNSAEMKEIGDLFEEKSKALGISQPLALASHSVATSCVALVVCKDSWQLYDASEGRMKQLMIRPCEKNVGSWMNGNFLSYNMLITWSESGYAFLYQLHSHILPGLCETADPRKNISTSGCSLLLIFSPTSPSCGVATPLTHSYATFLSHRWHILGDSCGRLQVWHIDTLLRNLPSPTDINSVPTFSCHFSGELGDSWKSPSLPCSLTDALYSEDYRQCPQITCSLFLTKFGRLICGHSNGEIVVLSATEAATKLLLQKRKFSRAWPNHYYLKGHTSSITALLYPSDYSLAYDSNYLLSGGADFSVRLWDLYKGKLVHTFAVHGGIVTNIVTCPPDINPRLQTCVCSIAEDHSVAILSTSQNKCLLLASCHTSPVLSVHWRLEEDFLLVNCADGRLYVWQIETGTLDRCIEGETAKIILDDTTKSMKPHSATSSISPVQVRNLSIGDNHSLIQILLFDPQFLINKLQKMEKVVSKPRPTHHTSQARAFRTYISARRNFSATDVAGGGKTPPTQRRSITSTTPQDQVKALEKIGDAVAGGIKQEVIQPEPPDMTINIARLVVSCLHAWHLDPLLDRDCEQSLGLVKPARPVSFGLLSRGNCLSLVLPGWGLVLEKPDTSYLTTPEKTSGDSKSISPGVQKEDISILTQLMNTKTGPSPRIDSPVEGSRVEIPHTIAITEGINETDSKEEEEADDENEEKEMEGDEHPELLYHVRWQLSRSLTTQHLLTVVSITNTLMNQSGGAHALATSSGVRRVKKSESTESEGSSDEEEQTLRDNIIRATWSRVAALHCVMLPERMAGYFRPPHLPVLASRFMDPSQAIREAAQALLQAELRRVGVSGRRQLVNAWAGKLQSPSSFGRPMFDSRSKSHDDTDFSDISGHATPTQQQQMTALVILGMIGAEFNSESKNITPQIIKKSSKRKVESLPPGDATLQQFEILDPSIARQTAKTLQAVLLEKPDNKSSLYSSLRCSAAELMGRGFHLWENYVDVPAIIMGLLDLAIHSFPTPSSTDEKMSKKVRAAKFLSEISRRALNLMVLVRPITVVNALAKEVSLFLGSQHGAPFPHSSLPPIQVGQSPPPNTAGIVSPANILLPAAKEDILVLIRTILDKCSSLVSLQLLDIVDIVLFCLDQEELKRRNFNELFPSLTKLPNVSYSLKTRRLAVGARSGQVGVYDLKQRKTQMVNAHTHQVTVLCFSEDGKLLATYSYGDSTLLVWHIGSSLLGGIITSTPKCIHSWPAISSSSPSTYSSYVRLEWASNKIIVLYMPGGIEYRYSM